jgi:hypothetical protein
MGYYKELGTGVVAGVDEKTGFPVTDYGHLLDPTDIRTDEPVEWKVGDELYNFTNPYGFLEFVIGNGDDFVCFDYRVLDDWVIVDATVNSETGSFIEGFGYYVVKKEAALDVVREVTEEAIEWCQNNEIRHSKAGWNQDEYYFLRAVAMSLYPMERCSERMMRYGGKRISEHLKNQ